MKITYFKRILTFFMIIIMLLSSSACTAKDNTKANLKDDQLEKKINEYLDILAKDDLFRGTVIITKDGEPIYEKAYGKASEEYSVANAMDTKYEIASITKQFTAASVLMLAQQKRLLVTDKICKYIPDYPNGDKITIQNLLEQNSGIAEYYTIDVTIDPKCTFAMRYTPEELIEKIKEKPLDFQPNQSYEYSNSNYVLLGYIIEQVSGKPWAQFVTDNIIKPLGLNNTGFVDRRSVVKNLATGYVGGDVGVERINYSDGSFTYAAGQMYSTVKDLATWNEALFSNKVLNKEFTSIMLSKHVKIPDSTEYYGYGVQIGKDNNRDIVWHSGCNPGFTSVLLRYVDSKTNIVILSNNEKTDVEGICLSIGHIYNNDKYEIPKPLKLTNINVKEMEPFIGTYKSEEVGMMMKITKENNNLIATVFYNSKLWDKKAKLFGLSKDTLYWKRTCMNVEFKDKINNKYSELITFGDLKMKRVE
ncbi:MAG: serine hydrolase domain-containing protein [Aminipila sp.]